MCFWCCRRRWERQWRRSNVWWPSPILSIYHVSRPVVERMTRKRPVGPMKNKDISSRVIKWPRLRMYLLNRNRDRYMGTEDYEKIVVQVLKSIRFVARIWRSRRAAWPVSKYIVVASLLFLSRIDCPLPTSTPIPITTLILPKECTSLSWGCTYVPLTRLGIGWMHPCPCRWPCFWMTSSYACQSSRYLSSSPVASLWFNKRGRSGLTSSIILMISTLSLVFLHIARGSRRNDKSWHAKP